jgi:nucleotide-binding universal stress UspA family protein
MIKKVLIATDGSAHATKAVEFGSDVAAHYDAGVVLVHVLLRHELPDDVKRMVAAEHLTPKTPLPSAAMPAVDVANIINMAGTSPTVPDEALAGIGEHILAGAEAIARDHGVEAVVKRVEDGKPVDRILAVAKDESVDLIVSGARGLSDLEALFVGSVSHRLSHLAPVTCLTVR